MMMLLPKKCNSPKEGMRFSLMHLKARAHQAEVPATGVAIGRLVKEPARRVVPSQRPKHKAKRNNNPSTD